MAGLGLARHGQRHQIGRRSAAAEAPAEAAAANCRREPCDHLPLDRHTYRGGAPGGHVLIENAGEQIRQRGHRLSGPEHVGIEAWRRRPAHGHDVLEHLQCHLLQAILRQRLAEVIVGLLSRDAGEGGQGRQRGEETGCQVRDSDGERVKFLGGQIERAQPAIPFAAEASVRPVPDHYPSNRCP